MSRLRLLFLCLALLLSSLIPLGCGEKHYQPGADSSSGSVKVKGQMDVGVEGGRGVRVN